VRALLKKKIKEKGLWGDHVRISSSGCLGLCSEGPNVVLYPSGRVFTETTINDVERIVDEIVAIVEKR